jgi:hypothetical protein
VLDPDVLAHQELGPGALADLQARLPEYRRQQVRNLAFACLEIAKWTQPLFKKHCVSGKRNLKRRN